MLGRQDEVIHHVKGGISLELAYARVWQKYGPGLHTMNVKILVKLSVH